MRVGVRNQKGFSLIEMLIIIALLGIIAGMASIGFDIVRKERVRNTTKKLLADVQKVRMDALVTGPSTTNPNLLGFGVRFVPPTSYVTFAFNDINGDYTYSGQLEELNAETHTVFSSISLQIRNDPTSTILIYDRFGLPKRSQPDGTPPAANNDVNRLELLVQDASVSDVKCMSIRTTQIREGAWDAGSSTCAER